MFFRATRVCQLFFLWYLPVLSTHGVFFYLFAAAVLVCTLITLFEVLRTSLIAELTSDIVTLRR